ncbi:MAG: ATP-binding cassette domain-containing protein [Bacteroidales bacterium]
MKETVLTINHLHKRYGAIHAVNDLSLEIEKGSIYGILGPNGSGKSTTLGIVLGTVNKTEGDFYWFDHENPTKAKKKIGALIENPTFYPYLSAENNLKLIADIKEVPYSEINPILEFVGLQERKNYQFKTFSLGMKQRLAIGAAMLGNPDVMILDEPTNGLDPKGIHEIRELILEISKKGITILLASHLLDEVQKTCSHVAILKKGKLLSKGPVDEIMSSLPIYKIAASNMESLKSSLSKMEQIKSIKEKNDVFEIQVDENFSACDLNKVLTQQGIYVHHLSKKKKSLETYFLEQIKEQA